MPSLNDFQNKVDLLPEAGMGGISNAAVFDPAEMPQPRLDDSGAGAPTFAALDLGTNNCRLLVARPTYRGAEVAGFKIIDSFSRIVRLGEGLSQTGRLAEFGDPAYP